MQKRSTARLDSMGSSVPKYKYIYMLCVVYGMAWHGMVKAITYTNTHARSSLACLLACLHVRTHISTIGRSIREEGERINTQAHTTDKQLHTQDFVVVAVYSSLTRFNSIGSIFYAAAHTFGWIGS